MERDIDTIRQQLEHYGYAVLPGLLAPEEIARLREIVGSFFGNGGGLPNHFIHRDDGIHPTDTIPAHPILWIVAHQWAPRYASITR